MTPAVARAVALTGATGFIGRHVARSLVDRGHRVRALTRSAPPTAETDIEWVRGDLGDAGSLKRLVDGCEVVVHCAGAVRGASLRPFTEVNVEGTARLAKAALATGETRRFLLVSSLAARHPELSWYAASKRRGEERLGEIAGGRMTWAAFRPTAVYGPGDREMRSFFRLMRSGFLPVPGPMDARVSLLHVDDLTRAVVAWVECPDPVQGVFELHDGTPGGYTWPRIAEIAGGAWGRPVRTVPVPRSALSLVAGLNVVAGRLLGGAPMLTPGKVRELTHHDWTCDNRALAEALGWEPRVDLATALREGRAFSS